MDLNFPFQRNGKFYKEEKNNISLLFKAGIEIQFFYNNWLKCIQSYTGDQEPSKRNDQSKEQHIVLFFVNVSRIIREKFYKVTCNAQC